MEDANVIGGGGEGIEIGCYDGGFIQLTDCEVANNAGTGITIHQSSGSEVVIPGSGTSIHNNGGYGIYWDWNNQQNITGIIQDANIYQNVNGGIRCDGGASLGQGCTAITEQHLQHSENVPKM